MPPKKNPSAPVNRVYRSSTPLQQSRFPARTIRVRYGRASKLARKQETLTQMDFVTPRRSLDEDLVELGEDEESGRRKKKRRKTMGDEPSSESKFHTQTMTQLLRSIPAEGEEEDSIYVVPSSSPRSKKLYEKNAKPRKPEIQKPSKRKSPPAMAPPQTPNRRPAKEIPSSESPATPLSQTSSFKGSALKKISINIPIPFNTNPKPRSSPKLPRFRVEDTFDAEDDSQQIRIPTTPTKRSSPAKSVRWAEVDEIHEHIEVVPATKKGIETRSAAMVKSPNQLRDVILDSEDDEDYKESEDDLPEGDEETVPPDTCYGEIGLETQKLLESSELLSSPIIEESQILGEIHEELEAQSTGGPVLGEENPEGAMEEKHRFGGSRVLGEARAEDSLQEKSQATEGQIPGEEILEEMMDEKTQYMESQRLATQHMRAMAPRTMNSDAFVPLRPQIVSQIVDRTRDHEFRRQVIPDTVSRMWIYETAPVRTVKYMAVISAAKRPGEILNEEGVGNVEFNAKAPNCGEYAWEILELYELSDPLPWTTIEANEWLNSPPNRPTFLRPAIRDQLMANLKPPLFCQTLSAELPTSPVTDTQEAEEQLLSNMIQYTQQPTFPEALSTQIKQEDVEEDGEAGKELPHSTPQDPSQNTTTPSNPFQGEFSEDDSKETNRPNSTLQEPSQETMRPPKDYGNNLALPELPRPSQAETVDLSQTQTQTQTPHHSSADVVFESPTRPIFSSTPICPPTLPILHQREHIGPESIVPYSIASSQLLTKSQMLPESLLNESVPGPPLFIQDSDDEDEL